MKKPNTIYRLKFGDAPSNFAIINGTPYEHGIKVTCEKVLDIFEVSKTEAVKYLSKLAGFYSMIVVFDSDVYLISDRIRSIPVFFTIQKQTLLVGSNAKDLYKEIGQPEFDEMSCEEFQLIGFVTGDLTLVSEIHQVSAGKAIRLKQLRNSWVISEVNFEKFERDICGDKTEKEVFSLVEDSLTIVIERLLQYADGRQICLPLSGGYDSRLIACMLVKAGVSNILAFSYGPRGNPESELSRKIAGEMGFRWHFVEYSDEILKRHLTTSDCQQYLSNYNNLTSMPNLQDWTAVCELRDRGVLEENCIFIPGHGGDILAGHRIPKEFFHNYVDQIEYVLRVLFRQNYSLAPLNIVTDRDQHEWDERINSVLPCKKCKLNNKEMIVLSEQWCWSERLSKFIVNSVRCYEFHGYDWWLPLLDKEPVEALSQIPLSLLENEKGYRSFVDRLYSEVTLSQRKVGNAGEKTLRKILRKVIIWGLPKSVQQFLRWAMPRRQISHFYICFRDPKTIIPLLRAGYLAQGIIAKDCLQLLRNNRNE